MSHKPRSTVVITPKDIETKLGDEDLIVSKTDQRGRITYINRTFMGITGFPERELIGQPHNVIRHPDMPRGVFYKMWQELSAKREFFGYVKNLCRDGSYYWVFANVTPDYDQRGHLRGYYSVRRKPNAEAVAMMKELYAQMRAHERQASRSQAPEQSWQIVEDHLRQHSLSYNRFMIESDMRKEAS